MTTPGGEVAPKVMFASTIDSDGSNDQFASSDEDEAEGGIAGIFNLSEVQSRRRRTHDALSRSMAEGLVAGGGGGGTGEGGDDDADAGLAAGVWGSAPPPQMTTRGTAVPPCRPASSSSPTTPTPASTPAAATTTRSRTTTAKKRTQSPPADDDSSTDGDADWEEDSYGAMRRSVTAESGYLLPARPRAL